MPGCRHSVSFLFSPTAVITSWLIQFANPLYNEYMNKVILGKSEREHSVDRKKEIMKLKGVNSKWRRKRQGEVTKKA